MKAKIAAKTTRNTANRQNDRRKKAEGRTLWCGLLLLRWANRCRHLQSRNSLIASFPESCFCWPLSEPYSPFVLWYPLSASVPVLILRYQVWASCHNRIALCSVQFHIPCGQSWHPSYWQPPLSSAQ